MLFLRSLALHIALYGFTVLQLGLFWPILLRPWPQRWGYVVFWGRTAIWLHRVICGVRIEMRGLENLPTGGYLVAAKHQAMWETFALIPVFPFTTFILKQELMRLPIFGWAMKVTGMIPIDRSGGVKAMLGMTARAKAAIAEGRQVVIFPEGTRRAPGAAADYKSGAGFLYESCGAPCLPVAHSSGLFWPRGFLRYPGRIILEFLPPIPPGLPRRAFMAEMEARIEEATQRILAETAAAADAPPTARRFRRPAAVAAPDRADARRA